MGKVIRYVEDVMELLTYQSEKRKLTNKEMQIMYGLYGWMENDENYISD